ncbi:14191_t:CDS:1, partial [Gigaspora rosea]
MLDPDYSESFEKFCSTQDISEDDKFKKYSSTVSLIDLLGFLYYRIHHKETWFTGIIEIIKCSIFSLFLNFLVLLGLITVEIPSFKLKLKRISMGKIEFDGINR